MVHDVVARFGRLDILVNNNAFPPTGGPTEQVSDLIWHEMTARLLDEPFYCLRAALRVMRPAGRGKIINMSSAAAFQGLANYAAYTAARAGVNGLTKAVGREVARTAFRSMPSPRTTSRTRRTFRLRSPQIPSSSRAW